VNGAAVVALPVALAIDLLAVVVLRRGFSMGRDTTIGIALALSVAGWALAARLIDLTARRRAARSGPPRT
jgi:hypothetical protein